MKSLMEDLNHPRLPEIHTILIWNPPEHFDKAEAYIRDERLEVVHQERIEMDLPKQKKLCQSVYGGGNHVKNNSIHLWIIRDMSPIYRWEQATACKQVLNANMKDHKERLRTILGGSKDAYHTAHTSYNVHEALLVLKPLGLDHLAPRPTFASFRELFQKLEMDPHLRYVVQRSFHELKNPPAWFGGKDVDVLVNDYYHFKALTGARGHGKAMRDNDNGYKIQNTVSIGGKEIAFDVRFVGDDYVDSRWEHDMLRRSVTTTVGNVTFHIPCHDDELYSLLYHVLVQKPDPSHSKHRPKLRELLGVQALPSVEELWRMLREFVASSGYEFKRPRDKGVGFALNGL